MDLEELQQQVQALSQKADSLLPQSARLTREHRHDGITATRTNLSDVSGMFRVVSAVPTSIPKSVSDQMQLYVSGSSFALYCYDYSGRAWKSINGSAFYGGSVTSAASGSTLPSGWSASVNGSHIYTITHNLGSTSYAVTFSVAAFGIKDVLQSKGNNSFTVDFESVSTGANSLTAFDFVLVKIA